MFQGELEGLKAIRNTNTVLVPRPLTTGRTDCGQHFIVMDYLNMTTLNEEYSFELGNQIADMHMCNWQRKCSLVTISVNENFIFKLCNDPKNNDGIFSIVRSYNYLLESWWPDIFDFFF